MSSKAEIGKSKYLSWALRHGLIKLRLIPDSEGYVKLDDLLNKANQSHNNNPLTTDEVLNIVKNCSKQRFGVKTVDTEIFIRANQGQSKAVGSLINSDELLVKLNEPIEGVFHGTYKKHLDSIQSTGLNRMERKHIHLVKSVNAISGQRTNCNMFVHVNMKQAMSDGIVFYESANGVILTEGLNGILPAKYLTYSFSK
jgi:2'-phosphotransferase